MNSNSRIIKITAAVIAAGIFIVIAVYVYFTDYGNRLADDTAADAMSFVQTRVHGFEYYEQNDKVKSLYRLLDKSKELARAIDAETASYQDSERQERIEAVADRYVYDQRIDGIILLDDGLDVEYQTDGAYELWINVINSEFVSEIAVYPLKSYISRIKATAQGSYYDFCAIAREDAPGILIAFVKKQDWFENNGDITIDTLMTGYQFPLDTIAVIADSDGRVLNSNSEELQGLSLEECNNIYGGWYVRNGTSGSYGISVYVPYRSVFGMRQKAVLITILIYASVLAVIVFMRQHIEYSNARHREKQLRIITSISTIYEAVVLIDLVNNRWEPVKVSDRLKSSFCRVKASGNDKDEEAKQNFTGQDIDTELSVGQMLDSFAVHNVTATQLDEYRKFTDKATIIDRLGNSGLPYIAMDTESQSGRWYMNLFVPQRYDADGNIEAVLFAYRDITETKAKEREYQRKLLESAEQAKRANIAKTDFLRRMSHDIRTPINGIRGMTDICRYYIGNKKKEEECLDKIMSASGFLLDLVNDVLDMNKLESGEIQLDEKPFELTRVIDEMSAVIEAQAAEGGITYSVSKHDISYDRLIGSSLHLRQVLQNILSNAIKYNVEGGSITLDCSEKSSGDGMTAVQFVCADTGRGMSREFQKQAYEPFTQENASARTEYKGTGLGLAITRKLVEQMGGEISFVSEEGKGTTFTIIIPFKIDNDTKQQQNDIIRTEQSDMTLENLNILIVDDNELNAEIAEFIVRKAGAGVHEARNGAEAVEIFKQSEPGSIDVILMDIMMPVMGGLEATRRIRALERADAESVIIIAMSANAFHDDVERSIKAGMNAHIAKPVDSKKLVRMVAQYYNKKAQ